MTVPFAKFRDDRAKQERWLGNLLFLTTAGFVILAWAAVNAGGQAPDRRPSQRVLILYSDERLLPANLIVDQAISTVFAADKSKRIELYSEFLSLEAETSVYRIVQEGLNNVVKHSNATTARVEIKRTGKQLVITVQDNGAGMSPSATAHNGHNDRGFGLAGISERVRLLGGSHTIDSAPARGTRLTVRLESSHVAAGRVCDA